MKIKIESTEDYKCFVFFTLEKEETKKEYKKILQNLQKKSRMNGFRPGKIPRLILEEQYGKEKIILETIMSLINEEIKKIIKEKKLEIIDQPKIDIDNYQNIKIAEEPINVKVTFELKPEFTLPSYRDLEVKVPIPKKDSFEAEDSRKQKVIRRLAQSFANWEDCPSESTIQLDDQVFLDYKGYFSSGEEIEGESDLNVPFIVRNNEFLPEADQQLLGLKAGEEKEIKTKMLEEDPNKKIAGKEVVFKIKVKKIQRAEELKIDDEFAQKLGKKDFKELESSIIESLKQTEENNLKERANVLVIHRIITDCKFEVPDWLIQKELKLSSQKAKKEDKQELSAMEKKTQYANRIKLNLLLSEIINKEKIIVSKEELNSNTKSLWNYYQRLEESNQLKKKKRKKEEEIPESFFKSVLEDMLFKEVEKWLFEKNKIEVIEENEENLKEYNDKVKELERLGIYK